MKYPARLACCNHNDYRPMLASALICGGASTLTLVIPGIQDTLRVPLLILAYISGGWYSVPEAIALLRRGKIDIHVLMIVVAVGAFVVGSPLEGATLLFLFSLSNSLESFARYRTERAISQLYSAHPTTVMRRAESKWESVSIEVIRPGDELLVRPGELFPTDGQMVEGVTTADESALTGESLPVSKAVGDRTFGGTLNNDGQAVIRVTALPSQSAVQKVLKMIDDAKQQKAPAERLTDSINRYYTIVVLVLSAVAFAVYVLFAGLSVSQAFYQAMVLLVVSSPCALVISVPSAVLAAIARGARNGILFRGGIAAQDLAKVNLFALDKTGTLTTGKLGIHRIVAEKGVDENDVLRVAASLEQSSTHPLALAIVREAQRRSLPLEAPTDLKNIPGRGITALLDGHRTFVGSRRFLADNGVSPAPVEEGAFAQVAVAADRPLGTILLADEVRAAAAETIEKLRRLNCRVVILSGDHPPSVQSIAAAVRVDEAHSECSPEDKLRIVEEWRRSGRSVAMTGDGINDAPSLAAADVAIVMGTRGSDTALEQADVVLMGDRLENIPAAVQLSRFANRVILQNLVFSALVILCLVGSAIFGNLGLTLGVLGHEGSTVVVVLNSLRLLGFQGRSG